MTLPMICRTFYSFIARRSSNLLIIIWLFPVLSATAQSRVIIQNVNIVDVKTASIIPEQTVVISYGLIQQIVTTDTEADARGTNVIDGTGQYLMPGLIDTHIHFFQSGGLYTRPDAIDLRDTISYEQAIIRANQLVPDHLRRYLRLGITTVADVGGPFYNFTVRDSVAEQMAAPNVLVTGPLFSTYQPEALATDDVPIVRITSTAAADSLFEKMLPYRPDLIKVWYIVTPEFPAEATFPIVKHIGQLAQKAGLPLAVHATQLRTAQLAVEAGANILVHSVSDSVVDDSLIELLRERQVTYVPTLIVSRGYANTMLSSLPHHHHDLRWGNPLVYGSLLNLKSYDTNRLPMRINRLRSQPEAYLQSLARADSVMAINLRKLTEAGVNVAVGTDAGNIGTLHASSYRRELEAMQTAGMSVAEIIRAATLNAAIGFGRQGQLGTVEEGKVADLLMLTQNPLEKLTNLDSQRYVIKSGQLLAVDTLLLETPEEVVQRQLNAYNARNIDAFLDTYADSVELYSFPNQLTTQGKEEMRTRYARLFENSPNLYAEIKNRIVIGNKVIDQEYVRAGDRYINAVAIYEVAHGKIVRVTFVRG